jgi:hypothetical protein
MPHVTPPWHYDDPHCAEIGTILFFAPDTDTPNAYVGEDPYKYARQVCGTCPHKIECAEWGIANEDHGMWGGLSPADRKGIRRKRGKRNYPLLPVQIKR